MAQLKTKETGHSLKMRRAIFRKQVEKFLNEKGLRNVELLEEHYKKYENISSAEKKYNLERNDFVEVIRSVINDRILLLGMMKH